MGTTILLADDHQIVRDGLRTLIQKEENMEVVAEASDGNSAVALAIEHQPDVIIMDITMPDLNGIEATRRILSKFPSTKVIALSMHSDKRFIAEILKAGAKGYMLKDCAFQELANAIRTVMNNETYLCPSIAGLVVGNYMEQLSSDESSVFSILTAREREVLQLLAEGINTKRIASKLNLSPKTIETHRRNIFDKLQMSSIAELTKYAIREGLTSLDK